MILFPLVCAFGLVILPLQGDDSIPLEDWDDPRLSEWLSEQLPPHEVDRVLNLLKHDDPFMRERGYKILRQIVSESVRLREHDRKN
jgi:hypothetical protein